MTPREDLLEFRTMLSDWAESLRERRPIAATYPEAPRGVIDKDGNLLEAWLEWAPLNMRAARLGIQLRSAGLLSAADQLDAGLEHVRGYVGAYEEGALDWNWIDEEWSYGPLDYVIEAAKKGVQSIDRLLANDATLAREWQRDV